MAATLWVKLGETGGEKKARKIGAGADSAALARASHHLSCERVSMHVMAIQYALTPHTVYRYKKPVTFGLHRVMFRRDDSQRQCEC